MIQSVKDRTGTPAMSSRSLRIVVADDEPEMRAFLQKVCEHLGHKVIAAVDNGQDLVKQCRREHPDLIVTDVIMPDIDGLTALEQISQHEAVNAIVITAHDWPELHDRAKLLNVKGYLIKPVGISDLKPVITAVAEGA